MTNFDTYRRFHDPLDLHVRLNLKENLFYENINGNIVET